MSYYRAAQGGSSGVNPWSTTFKQTNVAPNQFVGGGGFDWRSYAAAVTNAQGNQAGVNPGNPSPSDVTGAQNNSGIMSILQSLLGGGDAVPVDETFGTPGGNTLTGSSGKKKGAGSATLAKELQKQLQIQNLDEQKKLIDLQLQQDPQNYNLILAKLNLQTQTAQHAYDVGLRNLNSSETAAGAYTSQGANQARGDLATQLQEKLGGIDINRQVQALNEQYNQAALKSQSTMNFNERLAQAILSGYIK